MHMNRRKLPHYPVALACLLLCTASFAHAQLHLNPAEQGSPPVFSVERSAPATFGFSCETVRSETCQPPVFAGPQNPWLGPEQALPSSPLKQPPAIQLSSENTPVWSPQSTAADPRGLAQAILPEIFPAD